ncbi:hypothetical protein COBT_000929 [Conglomerata obtusa]
MCSQQKDHKRQTKPKPDQNEFLNIITGKYKSNKIPAVFKMLYRENEKERELFVNEHVNNKLPIIEVNEKKVVDEEKGENDENEIIANQLQMNEKKNKSSSMCYIFRRIYETWNNTTNKHSMSNNKKNASENLLTTKTNPFDHCEDFEKFYLIPLLPTFGKQNEFSLLKKIKTSTIEDKKTKSTNYQTKSVINKSCSRKILDLMFNYVFKNIHEIK